MNSPTKPTLPPLIHGLLSPAAYPHAVSDIRLLETHISWVILTGRIVYKIKKPVTLDFLDFGTLEKRRLCCLQELVLNRTWDAQLYLEVVPISGTRDSPSIGGHGPVLEYALKMRQFPQDMRLDKQLDAGLVDEADMRQLAVYVADVHARAKKYDTAGVTSSVDRVISPMLDNFPPVSRFADAAVLRRIETWTKSEAQALEAVIQQRQRDGFVRECHGDLHLRNLYRGPSGLRAFDCIEFSEELRTLDVISDIAFLVMDLAARDRQDLAYVFINRYLERTGDYPGVALLKLYVVYHCMIRAKVAAIRAGERHSDDHRAADIDELSHYCTVGHRWIEGPSPCLIAMHGYSGSGKTWLSNRLLGRVPAIRVRSDIERKRLCGLDESARSGSKVGAGIYTGKNRTAIYERLNELAIGTLQAGHSVIVDASNLRAQDRGRLQACADAHRMPLVWVTVSAQQDELLRRLRQRQAAGLSASEADEAVLEHQLANADPLTEAEQQRAVVVDTEENPDTDRIVEQIRQLRERLIPV